MNWRTALEDPGQKDLALMRLLDLGAASRQHHRRQGHHRAVRVSQHLVHHPVAGHGGKGRCSLRAQHNQVSLLRPALVEQFSNSCALSKAVQGGFYFHPNDEDLSPHPTKQRSLRGDPKSLGTPVKEKATRQLCFRFTAVGALL